MTMTRKLAAQAGRVAAVACAASIAMALPMLAGCSMAPGLDYARALAAGARAQEAGRFSEAARAYDDAATKAKTRDDAVHAYFLGAEMHERAQENAIAVARFDAIAALSPSTQDAPSAALAAAEIRLREGDDGAAAGLQALVLRFPNHGTARVAFHLLLRAHDQAPTESPADAATNAKATDAWLASIQPALATTELGAPVAYARAAEHETSGDLRGARDGYLAVAAQWPYPAGDLWDDALWHASLLDEKLGDPRAAIADLESMLSHHETALLAGSYQRARYSPAAWRVAELWRDEMHDRAKAREAFHRLYTEMTTSELRDDALWQESLLWGEEGDTGTACERLETLTSDFPDSRYVPCAAERCPRITREPSSRAPKTCRATIERKATEQAAKDAAFTK